MNEFAVSEPLSSAQICEFVPDHLHVATDAAVLVRRVWLDTPDGRLSRRGFSLVHVTEGARFSVVLESASERVVNRFTGQPPQWPADLPARIRERVSEIIGLRVLLPVRSRTTTATRFRLLNRDEKTVATISAETSPRGDRQRLRVAALRGYHSEVVPVLRTIGSDPRCSVMEWRAPKAPARPRRPTLHPSMPAVHAVAKVLTHLLDVVTWNVDGTTQRLDTEFLRAMRVRRTRSAIKLTADVLPPAFVAAFADQIGWLGDLTTPARDLDVLMLVLPEFAAALPEAARDDLEPLRSMLADRVIGAYGALVATIGSARFDQLVVAYRAELVTLAVTDAAPPQAVDAANRWARQAMHRVVKRGSRITDESPPQALHDLRKHCKELRYCVQLFGPLWAKSPALDDFLLELQGLQDNLGVFQDSEVQNVTLRRWAEEAGLAPRLPPATLLAIGRLSVYLEGRQAVARAGFSERFRHFSAPANRRRFEALIGSKL